MSTPPPTSPPLPPAPPASPADRAEPYGDILTEHFAELGRFFDAFEPEETDEALLRGAVTVARATIRRVETGHVAVSSPAVLRKLRATTKALKRALADVIDDEVADEDVTADPSGAGDPTVVKQKPRKPA